LCNGAILPDSTAIPAMSAAASWDSAITTIPTFATLPVLFGPQLLGPPDEESFPGWALCIEQQRLLI
jgi:hypothetical protein